MTLAEIGNIPVDFAVLNSMFLDHKSVHNKISELEKSGTLIRLKKGMYVVAPKVSGKVRRMCRWNQLYAITDSFRRVFTLFNP